MMRIQCAGYKYETMDGTEFDCEHPGSGEITCDEWIINGGDMSPVTGKKFRGNPGPYMRLAEERWRWLSEH